MTVKIDAAQFRRACARFATGITVCTVVAPDGSPAGLTANSFTSVSAEPPLVLICIDQRARIHADFRAAGHFGINVLGEQQQEISHSFATLPENRFAGIGWRLGDSGVPLLDHAIAQFECAMENQIPAGDHTLFLGRVLAAHYSAGDPLLYFHSSYRHLRPLPETPKL